MSPRHCSRVNVTIFQIYLDSKKLKLIFLMKKSINNVICLNNFYLFIFNLRSIGIKII